VLLGFFLRETAHRRAALSGARDRLEHNVAMRTAQLTHMVAERDHLLSEVYHRVKNNLQMIDSLIHVQAAHIDAECARSALADMRRRIHTLALVHEEILSAGGRDRIDATALLSDVCERIGAKALTTATPKPEIALDREHATPLALIAVELLARASEAAGSDQAVRAHLAASGPNATLTIEAAASDGDPWEALEGPTARGQIVRALTIQIGGGIARAAPHAITLSFRTLPA
jgi:two-component sensor histidine kinase